MSLAETAARPIFGQITVEQMRADEAMMRSVLAVVRDACKHSKGRFTVESVAQGLAAGSMRLYGVLQPPNAKLEATVVAKPANGVFEILVAGPDFADVAPFMGVLQKRARELGCERMSLYGPSFFRQKLPSGWFAREVRYECLLADGAS